MTTLTIKDTSGTPVQFGQFGQNAMSFPSVSESWTRRLEWNGGYFDGYFAIQGMDAIELFNAALGYRVTETSSGKTTFDGFVYEMVLRGTVDRVRSYDGIANSISARCRNLLDNSGFETGDFTDWTSTPNTGSITIETTDVANGTYSARLTSGATATYTAFLSQTVPALAKTKYRLTFYYDDTDGPEVQYSIATNIGDITPLTDVKLSGSRYRRFSADFITQPLATSITITLASPDQVNQNALFDDVRLQMVADERPVSVVLPYAENAESIATYGKKQVILSTLFDEYGQAITARDERIQATAFPKTQRGGQSQVDEPTLDVFVRSYWETLSWNMWTLETGGALISVSDALQEIVDNNEFIDGFVVNGSPADVSIPETYRVTQRDAMNAIIDGIGDGYHVGIGEGRTIIVTVNDWEPRYYMRDGLLFLSSTSAIVGTGAIDDSQVVPAIVRDLDYPLSGVEPDSVFLDKRDFLMDSVEVAASGISFGSGEF